MSKFNYDRPLLKKVLVRRATRVEAASGIREVPIMEIGMYLDEPGVFYDNQGNVIDTEVATRAGGFTKEQVAYWMREAEKRRRIAEIEAEYQERRAEAEGETPTDGGSHGEASA